MPALSEQNVGTAQEDVNVFVIALTASGSLTPAQVPLNRQGVFTMNNAGATTFTIDGVVTANYPIGYEIALVSTGAGTCTVTGTGSVTFTGAAVAVATTTGRTIVKVAPLVWCLY